MTRPYRGISPAQRHAHRRERLITAGADLIGTVGVAGLTMRAVCRDAELSQKFFYESFTDTDDLIREVYRTTFTRFRADLAAAAADEITTEHQIRAAVDRAARIARDDPRVCRILLVEPIAHQGLRAFVRETIPALISTSLARAVSEMKDPAALRMKYATVFGAIISLFLEWTEGNLGDDRGAFVDHVTSVVIAARLDPSLRVTRMDMHSNNDL